MGGRVLYLSQGGRVLYLTYNIEDKDIISAVVYNRIRTYPKAHTYTQHNKLVRAEMKISSTGLALWVYAVCGVWGGWVGSFRVGLRRSLRVCYDFRYT